MDNNTQKNNLEVFKNELRHSIKEASDLLRRIEWAENTQNQSKNIEGMSYISNLLFGEISYDIDVCHEKVEVVRFTDRKKQCVFKKINT